jgi:hypothetical protein
MKSAINKSPKITASEAFCLPKETIPLSDTIFTFLVCDCIPKSSIEVNTIDFLDENNILSVWVLNNNLPEFNITWGLLYDLGDLGTGLIMFEYGIVEPSPSRVEATAISNGIFWVEVKYIDVGSLFISSVIGKEPSDEPLVGWPFLIIVIGSPF